MRISQNLDCFFADSFLILSRVFCFPFSLPFFSLYLLPLITFLCAVVLLKTWKSMDRSKMMTLLQRRHVSCKGKCLKKKFMHKMGLMLKFCIGHDHNKCTRLISQMEKIYWPQNHRYKKVWEGLHLCKPRLRSLGLSTNLASCIFVVG